MISDNVLYVPVILEGLVHGTHNAPAADMTPDYSMLNSYLPPFGKSVVNAYFTTKVRKPGIYLHWTMPDALLSGVQREDGSVDMKALPNRFILQRLWAFEGQIHRKAWMILSDFLSNAKGRDQLSKTTVPTFVCRDGRWKGAGKKEEVFAYQGEVLEYGQELAREGYFLDKLTAVGDGNAAFAAYYPDCRSVFGFYDDMSDVPEGSYSYLLTGYYEDASSDPLKGASEAVLEELGWSIKEKGNVPQSVLCHGSLKQVNWQGTDYFYEDSIPKEEVTIYVGDTSAEALSAFIQDKVPDIEGMERIMNLLQNDYVQVIHNTANPDALIEAEELLHSRKFTATECGSLWVIRQNGTQGDTTLLTSTDGELKKLNLLQEKLDRGEALAESRRQNLYIAWWQYVTSQWKSGRKEAEVKRIVCAGAKKTSKDQDPSFFLEKAKEELLLLQKLLEDIKGWSEEIKQQKKAITTSLKETDYYLSEQKKGRYYQPNPPVLLLTGDGVKRSFKQGFQSEEDGSLPCRKNPISEITVSVGSKQISFSWRDIAAMCEPLKKSLPIAIEKLTAECMILEESFATCLAVEALKRGGRISYTEDELLELTENIVKIQSSLLQSKEAPYDLACKKWEQPWNPLFMEWKAVFEPFRTSVNPDNSFTGFRLGELDLELIGKQISTNSSLEIRGSSLLLPHAVLNMHDMMDKLVRDYAESGELYKKLKEAADAIKDMDVLSQQLDGFLDALRQQEKVPFLPLVPTEGVPQEFVDCANTCLFQGGTYVGSPNPGYEQDTFLPVRAGKLRLEELWLVDSFGQVKKISMQAENVRLAESLQMEDKGSILLAPRFLSPVKTVFEWDADRSVFGYLIPDFLDKCLQVYDREQKLLGFLQKSAKGAKWISAPGTQTKPEDVREAHLKFFVISMLGEANVRLDALLKSLDRSFASMESPDRFWQMCFGNVLALGRARIGLEEKGLPVHSILWDTQAGTNAYEKERVTVRLGDSRKLSDGLAGFYLGEDASEATYRTFYSCLGQEGEVYLSLEEEYKSLTVLFNPFGKISIRTGFLPSESVSAAEDCEKNAENLEMMFRLMPILNDPEEFQITLPWNREKQWSFHYLEQPKREQQIAELKAPSQLVTPGRRQILEGYMKSKSEVKE